MSVIEVRERLVDDGFAGCVQIRFDSGKRVPAADGHHHTGIELSVDEQALGEPPTQVVSAHRPKVVVTGRLGGPSCGPLDGRANPGLGQVDVGVLGCDVVLILEPLEIALDAIRQVGISRLPAFPLVSFPTATRSR